MNYKRRRNGVTCCPKDSIGEPQEIGRVRHRRINIEEPTRTSKIERNTLSFPFCTDCVIIIRNSIMPNSYELRRQVRDSKNAVRIDKTKYANLDQAQDVLLHALYIEEKLYLLLENFVEYEGELLSVALSRMVFQRNDYTEFRDDASLINRRLINLLSACRAYLDSLPHHVNQICSPSKDESATLKKAMNEQYDSVFGYRVMEALRNYVQHRGFPFQSLTISETAKWCGKKQVMVSTVDPFLEPKQLSLDGGFKKKVLNEMAQRGDNVYIKLLVRQYISSIRNIHRQARELVSNCLTRQKEALESALKDIKCSSTAGEGVAVIIADDGSCTDIVYLFPESERQREILCKRSLFLGALDNRFVSGVCEDDAENEPEET